MDTKAIVDEIDEEITRLRHAKMLLIGIATPKKGPGRPRKDAVIAAAPAKSKRHVMSAAGRARIAAAQKARWAKVKATKKITK